MAQLVKVTCRSGKCEGLAFRIAQMWVIEARLGAGFVCPLCGGPTAVEGEDEPLTAEQRSSIDASVKSYVERRDTAESVRQWNEETAKLNEPEVAKRSRLPPWDPAIKERVAAARSSRSCG